MLEVFDPEREEGRMRVGSGQTGRGGDNVPDSGATRHLSNEAPKRQMRYFTAADSLP